MTIGEADGVAKVYDTLTGKLETNLPAISVRAHSRTATQGHAIVKKLLCSMLYCYHVIPHTSLRFQN